MRLVLAVSVVLGVAACQSSVTETAGQGVGFESYPEYQRRIAAERQAQLGPRVVPGTLPGAPAYGATAGMTAAPGLNGSAPITASELSSAGISGAATLPGTAPMPATSLAPMPATSIAGAPLAGSAPDLGISDEQDFNAVASRETIETDRQRLEANRAQYLQIQPTALPEREGSDNAPDIIDYALTAPNRLGEPIYERSGGSPEATQRACAKYPSDAVAQEAFLKAGGPKKDSKRLDPDGDGFACTWDPTPFQKARG